MAFLGPYNAALINPSLVLLADAMHVSSKVAAYSTTTGIIIGGVSPFIWTPLTNYFGRRPVTLLAILLTILGGIGSGASRTFSALLGTRALCGFGFGGMMSVGTACVNDMFFLHERGEMTGVYSLFVTNGAHVAALGTSLPPSPIVYMLIPCSRRFPRGRSRMAVGLLPRRPQHHPLLPHRPHPLPRNPLLPRPLLPRHPP